MRSCVLLQDKSSTIVLGPSHSPISLGDSGELMSQIEILRRLAIASLFPSGDQSRPVFHSDCLIWVTIFFLTASKTRILSSFPAQASSDLPPPVPCFHDTTSGFSYSPRSGDTSSPVAVFQTRNFPPAPTPARKFPSGDHATALLVISGNGVSSCPGS